MILVQIIHIMRKARPYNQAFVLDYGWIKLMDTLTRFFQTTLQLAVVGLVWLVSDLMVRFAHLPISSGVLGLFLMLALLGLGVIKTGMVERGAKWVLGELVFSSSRLWSPCCNTEIC